MHFTAISVGSPSLSVMTVNKQRDCILCLFLQTSVGFFCLFSKTYQFL